MILEESPMEIYMNPHCLEVLAGVPKVEQEVEEFGLMLPILS
jgi:hypothetical protein